MGGERICGKRESSGRLQIRYSTLFKLRDVNFISLVCRRAQRCTDVYVKMTRWVRILKIVRHYLTFNRRKFSLSGILVAHLNRRQLESLNTSLGP